MERRAKKKHYDETNEGQNYDVFQLMQDQNRVTAVLYKKKKTRKGNSVTEITVGNCFRFRIRFRICFLQMK